MSNSELEGYLRTRKEAQTEVEVKNIMNKIYECVVNKARLIHAFNYSIPPIINDDGSKKPHPDAKVQLALIYSDKNVAYLPIYTSIEESKNRSNIELFPELTQLSFDEYYNIIFDKNSTLEGLVINPYTDNLILSKSRMEYLMNVKKKREAEEAEKENKIKQNETVDASIAVNNLLIDDADLKIAEYEEPPFNVINEAIDFAKKKAEIDAIWIFEKVYYEEKDGANGKAQLFVIQDDQSEEERKKLYQELKNTVDIFSVSSEIHVESLDVQRNDYVRKNGILPFYQKVNIYKNMQEEPKKENIQSVNNINAETTTNLFESEENSNTLVDPNKIEVSNNTVSEESDVGWLAIEKEFLRIYPSQTNPKHYGALIKWRFGGPDPLDGISIYDAGDYWHFVTFGLSELYEKESDDKEISGFGLEFTFKLKKGCYEDEEAEIKNICGLLQQIAQIIVVDKEMIKSYEYLYTGQQDGVDSVGDSLITGFITVPDSTANTIVTPNGKVEFVELIGATDKELRMIMDKELSVKELYEKLKTDVTNYKRVL